MIYLGVDPGKYGALCVLDSRDPQRPILHRHPAPLKVIGYKRTKKGNRAAVTDYDVEKMVSIVRPYAHPGLAGQVVAAIEVATTRPEVVGQQSALITGKGYGYWVGIIRMGAIPLEEVDARQWKAELFDPDLVPEAKGLEKPPQPSRKMEAKERNRLMNQRQAILKKHSCELARRLFPNQADWFKHYTTQDGVAEAALIGYWRAGEQVLRWTGGKPRPQ